MLMKKIVLAAMALVFICSCSGERGYLDYRGLSMGMPYKAFADSLSGRGFAVDTLASTGSTAVWFKPGEMFTVSVSQHNDTIDVIQESYAATYNDSTRNLFSELRDKFERELNVRPYLPVRGDDHKVARFESTKGTLTLMLENTYTPSLSVLYETATKK